MKRQRLYPIAALVAIVTFCVYLPALRNGFVNWDDNIYILDNASIRSLDLALLRRAFFGFYEANWIPLTWISHALDYALWGLNPFGHHLTNVALHAVNSFMVVVVVTKLLEAGRAAGSIPAPSVFMKDGAVLVAAAVTGLLFGIHPVHVESTAWVSERKDLLCALFCLLGVIMYTRHVMSLSGENVPRQAKVRGLGRWFLLALVCSLLALLSKPMAMTFPAVLLVLDWYPFRRMGSAVSVRSAFKEKIPFIIPALVAAILTIMAQKAGGGIAAVQPQWYLRVLVAVKALAAYLSHIVLPIDLLPYYPYAKDLSSYVTMEEGGAMTTVVAITLYSVAMRRRQPLWLAAWSSYVIMLLPVLGLVVQAGGQSMADRYSYLPSVPALLLLGLAAAWVWSMIDGARVWGRAARGGAVAATALICGVLAFVTVKQIAVWKNSVELWSHVIAKEPERVPLAYNNRGLAYKEQGLRERALEDFNKAISLDRDFANAYASRGGVYRETGQRGRALADYDEAVALDPNHAIAYNDRGMLYQDAGQIDPAIADFSKAVSLKPDFAQAYVNRGLAFEQAGRMEAAFDDYTAAIDADPFFANAYNNRGLLQERSGRIAEALEDLNAAVRLNPESAEAYNNRGLAFEQMGDLSRALADYDRTIQLDPADHLAYSNRAIVLEKMGRIDQAREDQRRAMSLRRR